MSQDLNAPQAQTTSLVDPNVPADQGLSALGLLMQLAGSVYAGFGALFLFVLLTAAAAMGGRGEAGMMILIAAASVARSFVHRMAGTDLLYRRQTLDGVANPLAGIKRYFLVSLGHTALVALVMKSKMHVPGKVVLAISAGLMVWPAVLAVMTQLPRFKRFGGSELPVAEDKGFEGASIFMIVFGACGTLAMGLVLYVFLDNVDSIMKQTVGLLLIASAVMLFIRSIFHFQAGLAGIRETSVDRTVELTNRYANFAIIASFCTGGALLLTFMMGRPDPSAIAIVCAISWLLLAWPMVIRRFYSERQFGELMAGDGASLHRRAPDAGLTGLGWLLLGLAAMQATSLLPQVILGSSEGVGNKLAEMMYMFSPPGFRSVWWDVGMVALQAWAGFELIRMSPHSRIIGSSFAVVATALTLYVKWPMLKGIGKVGFGGLGRNPGAVMMFVQLAIALVIPVTTLLLVNRKITPTATARYKPSGAPQG
jgi:hypothetical protein